VNNEDAQFTKISDSSYAGLLSAGLSLGLAAINKPSLELPHLFIGMPCIILGLVIIIRWNIFYEYRISILKWLTIISVFDFLIATVLFFKTSLKVHVEERIVYYLLNVITITLLIIVFTKKRYMLNNIREANIEELKK
jgi:hypothetical protein